MKKYELGDKIWLHPWIGKSPGWRKYSPNNKSHEKSSRVAQM